MLGKKTKIGGFPKLIIILLLGSISTSVARPYWDEASLNEGWDAYSPDLSELSRRAVNLNDEFPKYPGDYDEYPNDDKEEEEDVTSISSIDEVSDKDFNDPRTEEENVPWYQKAGKWIQKKYKTVKEEAPKVLEAGTWLKRQYKKLHNIVHGNDDQYEV